MDPHDEARDERHDEARDERHDEARDERRQEARDERERTVDAGPGSLVTAEELQRERLVTYIQWGDVQTPTWYWPTYAVLVAAWLAAYELGMWWGTGAALLVAVAMGVLIRTITSRTQVSTPRLRGMPRELQLTFVPLIVVLVVAVLVGVAMTVAVDDPPHVLFGIVVGTSLALAGMWNTRAYRRAASQLARREGIAR